jgi:arylamine N-acetyltransferase
MSTAPASRFVTGPLRVRRATTGGHALSDNRLTAPSADGSHTTRVLHAAVGLRQALEAVFGIALSTHPPLDATPARLAAATKDWPSSRLPPPGIAAICPAS